MSLGLTSAAHSNHMAALDLKPGAYSDYRVVPALKPFVESVT